MKVHISEEAGEQIRNILDYLEEEWSQKASDNFLLKLHKSIDLISIMPFSFPKSESFPVIRKCLVTKKITAYFRIDEVRKEVEILAVMNNRQNFRL